MTCRPSSWLKRQVPLARPRSCPGNGLVIVPERPHLRGRMLTEHLEHPGQAEIDVARARARKAPPAPPARAPPADPRPRPPGPGPPPGGPRGPRGRQARGGGGGPPRRRLPGVGVDPPPQPPRYNGKRTALNPKEEQ